jgi:hypothetical protein
VELGTDTKAVLLAAGIFFLWALLLGVWKYRQMATSPEGHSHNYVDIAHRAALLYSFAGVLLAVFVELSGWSQTVNLIAAFAVIGFMAMALSGYMYEGVRKQTDNQFRDPMKPGTNPFMWALIAAEIGGFAVLLAGFVSEQIL